MYSYILYKATKSPKVIQSGLSLDVAINLASHLYDQGKSIGFGDYYAQSNGVSVIVARDDVAREVEKSGHLTSGFKSDFQCGGY
jgi:hypothetical protein